jgi:pyrroloquinoline quinone (PQQ) biosynthesis protein C
MMTNVHVRLRSDFEQVAAAFHAAPACQRFVAGEITVAEYASMMTSIAWQARENPQIQAYATAFFRGHQRELVRTFLKHATSEIGHDQLAADDVASLGYPIDDLFRSRPRPGAVALTAFAYYAVDHLSPVAYLGYLYFLEALPTRYGAEYANAMDKVGIPQEARTFLYDHATIDVGHNRLMERYIAELIQTEADYALVQYAMSVTGTLYAAMVTEAFDLAPTLTAAADPMPLEQTARRAAGVLDEQLSA